MIDDFGLVNSGASSGAAPIKDIPAIVHGGVENLYAMPGGKSIGQYVPKSNRVTRRFSSGKVVAVTNDKLWEGFQKGVFKQDWTTEQWDAWFVANGEVITPTPTTACGKAVDEMTIDEKWQEAIGIALAKGHIDGEAKHILDELTKPENLKLFAGVAGALWSLVLAAEAAGASSVAGGPIGLIVGGATFALTADITLAIGAARNELDSATTCTDLEDASKNVGKAVVKLAAAGILAAIVKSVTAAAACVGKSQPKMLGPRRPVTRPTPTKPTKEPPRKPEPLHIDERPDLKDARKAAGSPEKELHTNPPKAENIPKRGKITGDPGEISRRLAKAKAGDAPTAAEVRTAKQLRAEGRHVHFVDDRRTPGVTHDLLIDGTRRVDVKRIGGLGSNAAGDLAKGVQQVGPGGEVIVVRPATAKASLEQYKEFVKKFKPKHDGVTFRVIDETTLPPL